MRANLPRLAFAVILVACPTFVSGQVAHRPAPPRPTVVTKSATASPAATSPTISSVESLKHIQGLSIRLENFGGEETAIRSQIAERFKNAGIKLLPDGTYPVFSLYRLGASGTFTVGYQSHDVHSDSVGLHIKQLLPLGSGYVEASTYQDVRMSAGLYVDHEKLKAEVLSEFFVDYEKASSQAGLEDVTGSPQKMKTGKMTAGDLVSSEVLRVDKTSPLLAGNPNGSKSRLRYWNERMNVIFADAAYPVLRCVYSGAPDTEKLFWYKHYPNDLAMMLQAYPDVKLAELGTKPVEECPAKQ